MDKHFTFKIDLAKNTLTLNYKCSRMANEHGSPEYNKVREILAENPGMKLVVESGRKAKTPHHSRRLTYKNMERYIRVQDHAEELLTTFALVKRSPRKKRVLMHTCGPGSLSSSPIAMLCGCSSPRKMAPPSRRKCRVTLTVQPNPLQKG